MHEATTWYAQRAFGLDDAFLDEVARLLGEIRTSPSRYPVAEGDTRKAVLTRFPYLILFRATSDEVVVTSCVHGRRNPKRWQGRR
ncbi:MAG: type II toxin-antitoxin system RelE/ParE family toxin [Longimicrobiales bacterium]